MNSLIKQIHQTEAAIYRNNLCIHQDYIAIKQHVSMPVVFTVGMITSFALGFYLSKRSRIIRQFTLLPWLVRRFLLTI